MLPPGTPCGPARPESQLDPRPRGGRPAGAGPQAAPRTPAPNISGDGGKDRVGQPLARPGGTLKGEDDRRFRLYTVIRIKIRSRVSIAREIGFRLSIAAAGRAGRFAAGPYYKAPKPCSPCYSHTLDPIFIQTTARAARARRGEDAPPYEPLPGQGCLYP